MLDAVVDYLPSPLDVGNVKGFKVDTKEPEADRRPPTDEAPFSGLALQGHDRSVRRLAHLHPHLFRQARSRHLCAKLRPRHARAYRPHAADACQHPRRNREAYAVATSLLSPRSRIPALAAIRSAIRPSRQSFCDAGHGKFPDPVIEMAIEPKSKADQDKMTNALLRLVQEDPSFRLATNPETGQTTIKGMGELHLEIKVDILRRAPYNVEVTVGDPQVAYRETITRKYTDDYKHKKQSGGSGQFASVIIELQPLPPGGTVVNSKAKIVGGSVPKECIPGVEKGLEAQKDTGVVAGFPCIDFKATLTDGAYHDVDSSALAFEIAARAAFREGMPKAGPCLLEPIMKVEVVTVPEEYMGDVIGDLNGKRRGQIQGTGPTRHIARTVDAQVPLANDVLAT